MYVVPYNTGEALLDFFVITHLTIPLALAYSSVTVQRVLSLSLFVLGVLALLFTVDAFSLFLPIPRHEFTHPFGPLALAAWATSRYLLQLLETRGITAARRTRPYFNLLWVYVGVVGGIMHRDFLLSWFLCWALTEHFIAKYLKVESKFRAFAARAAKMSKKSIAMATLMALGFLGLLELLAHVLNKPVLSPSLRIKRFAEYTVPGLEFVAKNAYIVGHSTKALPAGYEWRGFGDGFVTLPVGYLMTFRLDVPTLHGSLVVKKDLLDYMLPGLFTWAFDFGYIGAVLLSVWVAVTLYVGSRCLSEYIKLRRRRMTARFLAREALLFGCLIAFSVQSLIGVFLFSRAMNSFALATFTLLSALIWAHLVRSK
ncbi:hypothetical protein [Methanopyrus sp.]